MRMAAWLSFCGVLKTYFARGFTITSAAAQESSGVFDSSASALMAMVSPLVDGPMMARTFSSSMSCLAKETAFSALPPESLMIRTTFLPPMPPLAFMSATIISRVLASGEPRKEAGPVTARIAPTLIVSWASACGASRADASIASEAVIAFFMGNLGTAGGTVETSDGVQRGKHGHSGVAQDVQGAIELVEAKDEDGPARAGTGREVHVLHVDLALPQ